MMLNGPPGSGRCSARSTTSRMIAQRLSSPQSVAFSSISLAARRSLSMHVAAAAPRLSASSATAPVPENTSRTRAPSMRGARMLNNVSRSLSDVGRSPCHLGVFNVRPLCVPAMMRIVRPTGQRDNGPTGQPSSSLADRNQAELPLPHVLYIRLLRWRQRAILDAGARLFEGALEQIGVAHQVAGAQHRHAVLPRAEEVARPAQPQVALGDDEAVAGLGHRLQALARIVAP